MARTRRIDPSHGTVDWIDGYDPTRDHGSYGNGFPNYLRGFLAVGPGGPGCTCCFDAPKVRKTRIRAAKKAEKRRAIQEWDD